MHFNPRFPTGVRDDERRPEIIRGPMALALTDCRSALKTLVTGAADLGAMRTSIHAFAQLARREELPPERVLALFKEMVHSATSETPLNASERGEIMRSLTQIAIDAYYGLPEE